MKSGIHLMHWLRVLLAATLFVALAPVGGPTGAQAAALSNVVPNPMGWQDELVDGQGLVGAASSLALDSLGHPHISYYDFTSQSLKYAAWDGVAWQIDTVESGLGAVVGRMSALHPGLRSSLVLDGSTAYIAYEKNSDQIGVHYVRLAVGGPGGWNLSTITPLASPTTYAYAPSLRLDRQHNLQVIYTLRDWTLPYSAQQIIYGRLGVAATQWQFQAVDVCQCWSWFDAVTSSLALDRDDNPRIAYAGTPDGTDSPTLRYAWRTGPAWQTEDVDMQGDVPALALDATGLAHIAYLTSTVKSTSHALKYANQNGSTWQLDTISTCLCRRGLSLALDGAGRPHLAVGIQNALDWLWWDGAAWQSVELPGTDSNSNDPALALDAIGNAHITYADGGYQDLHHLAWGPAWITQTVAPAGDEARLAVDVRGLPYISYLTSPQPYASHVQLANWALADTWQYREALPFNVRGQSLRLEYDLNRQPVPIFSYTDLSSLQPRLGFARLAGAQLVTRTVDATNDTGWDSSLAFDYQANLIIGYTDQNNGGPTRLKYAASPDRGQSWQVISDTAAPPLGPYSGAQSLSAGGSIICCNTYVAYLDQASKALRLATWDGAHWTDERVDGGNGDYAGAFVSLAVDQTTGKPAMAYFDATYGEIRYALWRGAWITTTVDSNLQSVGDVSLSLAQFSDQYPRITYTARADKSLRLAWSTAPNATWTIESVAAFSTDPVGFPSLRVSSQALERDQIAYSAPALGVVYAFHTATLPYPLYYNPLQPCLDVQPPAPLSLGQTLAQVRALSPAALGQVDDLTTLRALRDLFALSPAGQHYISLYYQYSKETGALGLAEPALSWDAYRTLQNFLPGFLALAAGQGDTVVITQAMVDQANNIADRLVAAGSPALGAAINTERGKYSHLQAFVGKTFAEAGTLMGINAYRLDLPLVRR